MFIQGGIFICAYQLWFQVYAQLRDCLYQDDAVTGEAAGLAMGLVMVGGMHQGAFQEMVQYVCDTQHDKIQRGLRTGIALLAYGMLSVTESPASFSGFIFYFLIEDALF